MKHTYKKIPLVLALALGLSPVMTHAQELHTVKAGDTLWGISQNYDISVNEIKSWNKLDNNILYVGQKLVIEPAQKPSETTSTKIYTVKSGDSLYAIALEHNVTVADLQNWNNMKTTTIYVGQKLQLATANTTPSTPTTPKPTNPTTPTTTYTVKSGDTLFSISREYKVSVADLQKWNKLDTTTLMVGQKLSIGGSQSNPSQPETVTKKVGTVKASLLNVRSDAGTSHSIVGSLSNNTKVTVLNEKNGWVQIEYQKIKGWVSAEFLTIQTTESTVEKPKEEVQQKAMYQVTASVLNVRKDPTTGNNLIDTLLNGATVEELERKGTWSYVSYGAKKGWVSNDFLKKVQSGAPKGKTVVIDPGHGGVDSGALGSYGFNEEDANLAIALVAQRELQAKGYTVAMVRTGDYECSKGASTTSELQCRVKKVDENKGDIFISIHNNSATPAAKGTETYYTPGKSHSAESLRLANALHKHYQPAFGSLDRKVKQANYYVTNMNTVPAVLLEVGFMSNSDDLAKLKSSTYQEKVGRAIANGVDEYFGF